MSMGFSRQEYWSRLLFLSPGHLSDPGIKSISPSFASGFFITELPGSIASLNKSINNLINGSSGLPNRLNCMVSYFKHVNEGLLIQIKSHLFVKFCVKDRLPEQKNCPEKETHTFHIFYLNNHWYSCLF